MLFVHSLDNPDPYLRAAFPLKGRLARLVWNLTWLVLFRPSLRIMHPWRSVLLRLFGAKIGKNNLIYPDARIWAPWLLETEDVVTIGPRVELYNPGGLVLRHHCVVSQDAFVCGATHDYNDPAFPFVSKRVVLEPYSWVCARAIVLPGVNVGEGAVLGAGSVTSRDLEPWSVYAGNPALRLKARSRGPTGKDDVTG